MDTESEGSVAEADAASQEQDQTRRGPRREPAEIAGYRLVARARIPLGRVGLLGLILTPVWLLLFGLVGALLGGPTSYHVTITIPTVVGAVLIMMIVVPVVHEAVHGIIARIAGARPTFGVGPGYAYTTFQELVGVRTYLAIGLGPLVILSILSLAIMASVEGYAGWALLFGAVNAGGAIGDIWMALTMRGLPANARMADLADGFAVYLPDV